MSKKIYVGKLAMGGGSRVSVQTMATVKTEKIKEEKKSVDSLIQKPIVDNGKIENKKKETVVENKPVINVQNIPPKKEVDITDDQFFDDFFADEE